jgi:hypothetical protein
MTAFIVFLVILGIVALAARFGTDSRTNSPGRQF